MIEICVLSPAEFGRVREIDVSERGDIVYHVEDRRLVPVAERWTRGRDEPLHEERWLEALETGGTAFGAFEEGTMVGVAVFRPRLRQDMGQLAALFVDRGHRRRGVATLLVGEVLAAARGSGARRLYVSATPSESAVGLYRSLGFDLADEVDAELFALEPDDVHMIRRL